MKHGHKSSQSTFSTRHFTEKQQPQRGRRLSPKHRKNYSWAIAACPDVPRWALKPWPSRTAPVHKNGLVFTLRDDVIEPVSLVCTLSILQPQSGVYNCRLHFECVDYCSSSTVGCEVDPLMLHGGRLDCGHARHLSDWESKCLLWDGALLTCGAESATS